MKRIDAFAPPPAAAQALSPTELLASLHLYLGFGDRPNAMTRREIVESFHEPARAVSESSVEVKDDQPVRHAFPSPSRNGRIVGGNPISLSPDRSASICVDSGLLRKTTVDARAPAL